MYVCMYVCIQKCFDDEESLPDWHMAHEWAHDEWIFYYLKNKISSVEIRRFKIDKAKRDSSQNNCQDVI